MAGLILSSCRKKEDDEGDDDSPDSPGVTSPSGGEGDQADGPVIECTPASWSDSDLKEDPGFHAAEAATSLRTTELPLLTEKPSLLEERKTFTTNTVARAERLSAAYADCAKDRKVRVGGIHFYAHENNVRLFSKAVLVNYVDMLNTAGVDLVGIHVGPYPWLVDQTDPEVVETLDKYDAIMKRISDLGMAVRVMLPISNSSSVPMTSWEDYAQKMRQVVEAVLARYDQVSQVGMHEPTSVCKTVPCGGPTDPEKWRTFVDDICALATAAGIDCTASLIAGPEGGGGEWDFQLAALRSQADYLGVNNIDYYGIWQEKIGHSDTFIRHFKTGMTDPDTGEQVPGRGNRVFLNAFWRPSFPQIEDMLVQSNGAGLGCKEYQDVDDAYLKAMFTYARAWGLTSLNAFYTDTFVFKKDCPHTTNLYLSVKGRTGEGTIPNYQEGNSLTDSYFRYEVRTRLEAGPPFVLSATGQTFSGLALEHGTD